MNTVTLILKGQEYKTKLDFRTLANIQSTFRKNGRTITMQEVFDGIAKQDFEVIVEVVVQSILRCHPQLKRTSIEDKLDFEEITNVFEFIVELASVSLPQSKEKTDEEGNL